MTANTVHVITQVSFTSVITPWLVFVYLNTPVKQPRSSVHLVHR